LQQIGKVQAAQRAQDASFAQQIGTEAGKAPQYQLQLENQANTQAYRDAQLGLSGQRLANSEQSTAFNQKYKAASYNLSVTKAQWAESNANRSYGLSYARYMQAEAKAQAIAKHGGLSAASWNTLQGKAQDFTKNLYQGVPGHVTYPNATNGLKAPRIDSWKQQPLTYQKAINTLIQRYPALGASGAVQLANGLYQPGEGGRPTTPATAAADALILGQSVPGGNPPPLPASASSPPSQIKTAGLRMAARVPGWAAANQQQALDQLWSMESGWDPAATNPTSGALGIPQALGHKLPADYATNPVAQIQWGLNYIRQRYGSPVNALAFHLKNGWY
jgi:hypothetical protein